MTFDTKYDINYRLLTINSHHPEALRMQILYAIGIEGKYPDGANRLGELIQVFKWWHTFCFI